MRSEYTNKETEVMSPGETSTQQEQIKETSEEELNKKHGWKQTIKRNHRKNQKLKHRGIKILFHSCCHISENQHNVKQQQQQEFRVHNRKTLVQETAPWHFVQSIAFTPWNQ